MCAHVVKISDTYTITSESGSTDMCKNGERELYGWSSQSTDDSIPFLPHDSSSILLMILLPFYRWYYSILLMILLPFYWWFYLHSTWFYSHSTIDSTAVLPPFYWWLYSHSTDDPTPILLMIPLPFYWRSHSHSTDDPTPILRPFYWVLVTLNCRFFSMKLIHKISQPNIQQWTSSS